MHTTYMRRVLLYVVVLLVLVWSVALFLLWRGVALLGHPSTTTHRNAIVHVGATTTTQTATNNRRNDSAVNSFAAAPEFALSESTRDEKSDNSEALLRAEIDELDQLRRVLRRREKDFAAQQKLLKASEIVTPFVAFCTALRVSNVSLRQIEE